MQDVRQDAPVHNCSSCMALFSKSKLSYMTSHTLALLRLDWQEMFVTSTATLQAHDTEGRIRVMHAVTQVGQHLVQDTTP